MRFAIEPQRVDVWVVRADDVRDEDELDACRRLLTQDELAGEARFRFPHDRHLYVLTRSLVRSVLAGYTGLAPEAQVFARTRRGRPWLANAPDRAPPLSFNLSHTRGLLLLGVAGQHNLGVDVETLDRPNLLHLSDQFFAPSEIAALQTLPLEQRHERFFEYWTLKESYIKARSEGLSLPLEKFAFNLELKPSIGFMASPEVDERPARWVFQQFRPASGFIAAVCAEATPSAPHEIAIRHVTPILDCVTAPEVLTFPEIAGIRAV